MKTNNTSNVVSKDLFVNKIKTFCLVHKTKMLCICGIALLLICIGFAMRLNKPKEVKYVVPEEERSEQDEFKQLTDQGYTKEEAQEKIVQSKTDFAEHAKNEIDQFLQAQRCSKDYVKQMLLMNGFSQDAIEAGVAKEEAENKDVWVENAKKRAKDLVDAHFGKDKNASEKVWDKDDYEEIVPFTMQMLKEALTNEMYTEDEMNAAVDSVKDRFDTRESEKTK